MDFGLCLVPEEDMCTMVCLVLCLSDLPPLLAVSSELERVGVKEAPSKHDKDAPVPIRRGWADQVASPGHLVYRHCPSYLIPFLAE